MAHIKSITERIDGKFVNLPTVVRGKTVSRRKAIDLFKAGKLKALGSFSNLPLALVQARVLSESPFARRIERLGR